jgi:hypothetical protein
MANIQISPSKSSISNWKKKIAFYFIISRSSLSNFKVVSAHSTETYGETELASPLILNLGTKWSGWRHSPNAVCLGEDGALRIE